jgi:hypothetical protein
MAWGHDAQQRLRPGHVPAIFPAAYEGSEAPILEALGRHSLPQHPVLTGRSRRPSLRWPPGLAYGQVEKQYTGRGSERVDGWVGHGKARLKHVEYLLGNKVISAVEHQSGTSRWRNQRKVRKPLALSKATRYHRGMSWLAVGLYNFCHAHSRLKS